MTPEQTQRGGLRYKARLPRGRSWGLGEQDRAEEDAKEDGEFRRHLHSGEFSLISSGGL